MSQALEILEHIKRHGSITPAEAYTNYGCLAMHSRAAELRERGYEIVCKMRVQGRKRFGEYRLVGQSELAL